MGNSKNINIFWWSSVKFEGKPQENFGDILSKYLVEKISGKTALWVNPRKHKWNPFKRPIFTTTGSILKHISTKCIVWGSGIISKEDQVDEAVFLAVRGPETYTYLVNKGYKVNKVFGDPAIVLPDIYNPKINPTYTIGIIPHYVDYDKVNAWYKDHSDVKVINLLNNNVEEVIDDIVSCKSIISSSLHGVIVSHTYNIKSVWVKFSKKLSGDNIKFADYFRSVDITPYEAKFLDEKVQISDIKDIIGSFPNSPNNGAIEALKTKLMEVCPFKK